MYPIYASLTTYTIMHNNPDFIIKAREVSKFLTPHLNSSIINNW